MPMALHIFLGSSATATAAAAAAAAAAGMANHPPTASKMDSCNDEISPGLSLSLSLSLFNDKSRPQIVVGKEGSEILSPSSSSSTPKLA